MTSRVIDVPAGEVFDAWRLPVLDRVQFDGIGPRAQLEYLASLALVAPTTHNTVPQRMHVDPDHRTIAFALDRRAILRQSDVNGRQATVSLGAAIANAALAADAYGRTATITVRSDVERLIRPAERWR